jgi:hypothetical protein
LAAVEAGRISWLNIVEGIISGLEVNMDKFAKKPR